MEDMISRIIELDKQVRDNAVREKQFKVDLEQKISDLKEKKRAEYVERAQKDIQGREKDEKIKACIKLSAIEGIYKKRIERLGKIYSENKESWINSIVKRVVES